MSHGPPLSSNCLPYTAQPFPTAFPTQPQAVADRIEVDASITEEVLADAAKKTEGFSGGLPCRTVLCCTGAGAERGVGTRVGGLVIVHTAAGAELAGSARCAKGRGAGRVWLLHVSSSHTVRCQGWGRGRSGPGQADRRGGESCLLVGERVKAVGAVCVTPPPVVSYSQLRCLLVRCAAAGTRRSTCVAGGRQGFVVAPCKSSIHAEQQSHLYPYQAFSTTPPDSAVQAVSWPSSSRPYRRPCTAPPSPC